MSSWHKWRYKSKSLDDVANLVADLPRPENYVDASAVFARFTFHMPRVGNILVWLSKYTSIGYTMILLHIIA